MNPEQRRIFALFPRSGKTGGRLPSPWADPTAIHPAGQDPEARLSRLCVPKTKSEFIK